jgi:hypothetical protein
VVVDKKVCAFVKMTKTLQFRQPALPRAFPSENHMPVRAFYVDQNYGLNLHLRELGGSIKQAKIQ